MRAIRKRPAGRRHSGGELQGRVGPGPGRDQRPLRRRARHGRPPRHPEERHQGDRLAAGQGRHLHVEVELRPRRLELACPRVAVGRGRQDAAVLRPQGRVRHVAADALASSPASSNTRATSPISSRPTSIPTSASRSAPSRRPRRSGAATTAPPASACAARAARRSASNAASAAPTSIPIWPSPALIAAGLAGIEEKLEAGAAAFRAMPIVGEQLPEVPKTLREAADALRASKMLRAALRRRGGRSLRPHRRMGAVRIRPAHHRLGTDARLRALLRAVMTNDRHRLHLAGRRPRSRAPAAPSSPPRSTQRARRRAQGAGATGRTCRSPSARSFAAPRSTRCWRCSDEIVPELAWQMGRPVRYGGGEMRGFEERARHMIAHRRERAGAGRARRQGRLHALRPARAARHRAHGRAVELSVSDRGQHDRPGADGRQRRAC